MLNLRSKSESSRPGLVFPGTGTQQTRSALSSLNFGVGDIVDEFSYVGDSPEIEETDG